MTILVSSLRHPALEEVHLAEDPHSVVLEEVSEVLEEEVSEGAGLREDSN